MLSLGQACLLELAFAVILLTGSMGVAGTVTVAVSPRHSHSSSPVMFNEAPSLMAHDAATGYLDTSSWDPVLRYAKTQSTGFTGQLECGARAFDLRPMVVDGQLLMVSPAPIKIQKKPRDDSLLIVKAHNAFRLFVIITCI